MDARQSFYLAARRDDFAEPAPDAGRLVADNVAAANDNLPGKERLSARWRALLRRLLELTGYPHSSRKSNDELV
jgi:hypothetical protein